MTPELEQLANNPSLIYQLKRSLGDDNMSLVDAIQLSVDQAVVVRGMRTALHDLACRIDGVIPKSAEGHVCETELVYAGIRKPVP